MYSNTETALAVGPPVGYNFALTYDGGRVSIHKDGEALDIYGDGVYTPDSLWDVPGYSNRPAEEGDGDIRVYLAAIAQPVRVRGCYSSLYELQQGLTIARWFYLGECAVLGLALLLLLLAFLWRDARREARLALAGARDGLVRVQGPGGRRSPFAGTAVLPWFLCARFLLLCSRSGRSSDVLSGVPLAALSGGL